MSTPVIAIFDIGKTNKKVFLFDEDYQIRYEQVVELPETEDEDGFPCEDIHLLTKWVKETFHQLSLREAFRINAINVSAHGASFVHLDKEGKVIAPLYNYLKPFPEALKKKFYDTYGGEADFSRVTASPVLGNLNSGMQLYWLKHQHPRLFQKIKYSLHLPEYISYVFTSKSASGITSIGCHTNLWDFTANAYHPWVEHEGILQKLAPIAASDEVTQFRCSQHQLIGGIGLHDSSAALIPYLASFSEPFVLISTGTWCISLNPFNHTPLTREELEQDCLCYLTNTGKPVKASRFFGGHWHEQEAKRLADHFHVSDTYYQSVVANADRVNLMNHRLYDPDNLALFSSYEEAYTSLIAEMAERQVQSTNLVLNNSIVKDIFVDGGFSQNNLFMNLLARHYTKHRVAVAQVAQASATGAALSIHPHWNTRPVPADLIQLTTWQARSN